MSFYCVYNKERIWHIISCGTDSACDCREVDRSPSKPCQKGADAMSRISDDDLGAWIGKNWKSPHDGFALDLRDARSEIARLTEENALLTAEIECGATGLKAQLSASQARLAAATTVTEQLVDVLKWARVYLMEHTTGTEALTDAALGALRAFVAFRQAGAGKGENQEGDPQWTAQTSTSTGRSTYDATPAPHSDDQACGADPWCYDMEKAPTKTVWGAVQFGEEVRVGRVYRHGGGWVTRSGGDRIHVDPFAWSPIVEPPSAPAPRQEPQR